ncbi:MAG: hypothetical protein HY046_08210 [Acidobacteria bacterium]|nr:hypothetical protein [Acidobacteriota bacterium]
MTIAGAWELNRDESDDARKKMQDARGSSGGSGGGYPGGGRRGGGYPGGGGSRGGIGGRGGYGGQRGQSDEDRRRMEELFRPARMLTIERKETEVDVTDDLDQRKIFYTDGRKLQKPKKDEIQTEFSAKWEGDRLVSEGKDSRGDKITRTFELARDGESLYEILYIERSSNNGTYIRYVYDRSGEEKRPGQ